MSNYNPSIPASTDDPTVSQGQLLNNFSTLNNIFAKNHIALTAQIFQGQHTIVQFPAVQASDPAVTAQGGALYTKNQASSSTTELFFRNLGVISQLTNLPLVNSGTNWGIRTPWDIIINAGLSDAPIGSTTTANFAIHYATSFIIPLATASSSLLQQPSVATVMSDLMTVTSTTKVYYIVIGR